MGLRILWGMDGLAAYIFSDGPLSFEEIRSELYDALVAKTGTGTDAPGCWIENVYPNEFIYHVGEKLLKAPYKIEDGEAIIGDGVEVEKKVSYEPCFTVERLFAAFKEKGGDEAEVLRTGKLFEAGDFPDKGVSFDDSDLETAANNFTPVDNDLEHIPTVLDGRMGQLKRVWKKGSELFGTVSVPKWLDEVIGEEPIKVSLAFDRSKRIVGNALVLRPRIADAAVMAAFSAANSSSTTNTPGSGVKERKNPMKLKEAIKHLFGKGVEDLEAEVTLPEGFQAPAPTPITPPATPAAPTFNTPTEDPEKDALKAQIAAFADQALTREAFAFADGVIRDRKALPSQRDQIAGMFTQAVKVDAKGGPVFSTSGLVAGDSVTSVKAFFASAPAHAFSGESIPEGEVALLFAGKKDENMDGDKMKKMLAMTALGQKAAKNANC